MYRSPTNTYIVKSADSYSAVVVKIIRPRFVHILGQGSTRALLIFTRMGVREKDIEIRRISFVVGIHTGDGSTTIFMVRSPR